MVRIAQNQGAVVETDNEDTLPERPREYSSRRRKEQVTPSEEIITSVKKVVLVTDDLGRTLRVKYLSTGDRMRIAKVLGGDLAKNEIYLGYATLAFAVTEINGDMCPPMVKPSEVEFMVDRLGD